MTRKWGLSLCWYFSSWAWIAVSVASWIMNACSCVVKPRLVGYFDFLFKNCMGVIWSCMSSKCSMISGEIWYMFLVLVKTEGKLVAPETMHSLWIVKQRMLWFALSVTRVYSAFNTFYVHMWYQISLLKVRLNAQRHETMALLSLSDTVQCKIH